MTDSNLTKILEERYERLPSLLQEKLFDPLTADIIWRIAQLNNLPEEKINILSRNISKVLLGLVHYKDFPEVLREELKINPLITQAVAQEIDREIFLPLRKYLRQAYAFFGPLEEQTKERKELVEKEEKPKTELEEAREETISEIEEPQLPKEEVLEKSAEEKLPEEVVEEKKMEEVEKVSDKLELEKEKLQKEEKQPWLITPSEPEEKPIGAKKSFLSFFKFKKIPEETKGETTPTIVGKETEIKPILEVPSSFKTSFEEVVPPKEKVISEIKMAESEEKKPPPFIKIVNYKAEEMTPSVASPSSEKEVLVDKTSTEAAIRKENLNEIETKIEEKEIPATEVKKEISIEKPLEAKPVEEKKEELPQEKIEEKTPESLQIPPENIIDLRKFKF